MVDLCTVILVVHAVLNSKVNGERLLIHHDNNNKQLELKCA